jgi:V/A-type H+-transporting ATPase subunit A
MSGRLEEIPGEEAFPAYLESTIAGFYERAGRVRLKDGSEGSVTIGGTVSPAGGNFEEPVTQATLKVVGAFHGLSRERSDARKYPAIHPLESWSKYTGVLDTDATETARAIIFRGNEVEQMMKVVGEEGTSTNDYITYLKGDLIDTVYMQQNSFDPVDNAVSIERQKHIFGILLDIITSQLNLDTKENARIWFNQLRQKFLDYNGSEWECDAFKSLEKDIRAMIDEKKLGVDENLLASKTAEEA